jgi:predicted GH43/DUF377 family glycosyl hydrolase
VEFSRRNPWTRLQRFLDFFVTMQNKSRLSIVTTAAVCYLLPLLSLLFRKDAFVLGQGQGSVLDKAREDDDDDFPNCTDRLPRQGMYDVIVTELDAVGNHGASLISQANGSSEFEYNFNAAWFPSQQGLPEGLMVRLVDFVQHPEWANAGALAVVPVKMDPNNKPLLAQYVTQSRVTWAGAKDGPQGKEVWGAVDPRIVYRPKTQQYYLTWDNCTKNCWPQRITYLSTTSNPYDPHAWILHGPVFPFPYSSGAALLFHDDPEDYNRKPHLAFVCNSNTANAILIAESNNTWNWSIPEDPARRILMKGRPGCWDASGIAAGPQPERLSVTGDYLLIYNIDTGYPYHPNPLGRCAIGWAILDGEDPTKIVARSRKPLLIATRPWETCPQHEGRHDPNCQVPMVVFASGLKPLPNNEFYVVYGGADTVVGVSKIKVTIRESQRNPQGSPLIHVEEASR